MCQVSEASIREKTVYWHAAVHSSLRFERAFALIGVSSFKHRLLSQPRLSSNRVPNRANETKKKKKIRVARFSYSLLSLYKYTLLFLLKKIVRIKLELQSYTPVTLYLSRRFCRVCDRQRLPDSRSVGSTRK